MPTDTFCPFEAIIETLKQQARDGWKGPTGEERAAELDTFIRDVVTEYAAAVEMPELNVLAYIEEKRDHSAVNYYQRANFPHLDKVRVFATVPDFRAATPSGKFRCPSCEGISGDPYGCDTGNVRKDGSVCNWKSYGFFGTAGKGASILIKDHFEQHPAPIEIFMPLEFEAAAKATS